jgi:GSCFA family
MGSRTIDRVEIAGIKAIETLGSAVGRFPGPSDARTRHGPLRARRERGLVPAINPRFRFEPGCRVFTIGSCFARNIEEHLIGYDVPTRRFSVPKEEWPHRPNGLLNEYNPGTIAQRIERALTGEAAPRETLVPHKEGFVDLLLPSASYSRPVTQERAVQRREEIDAIYRELPQADIVIVTLGLVEAWFDSLTGSYLNRMPPTDAIREDANRFSLHVMDVDEGYPLLAAALGMLAERGQKILLTVSPVPLTATFSEQCAVVANSFSKAVLRVCAHRLEAGLPGVDYFPSYEMVMSRGLSTFSDDNVHVQDAFVHEIVRTMLDSYVVQPEPRQVAVRKGSDRRKVPAPRARIVTKLAFAVLLLVLLFVGLPELLGDRPYDPAPSAWPSVAHRL